MSAWRVIAGLVTCGQRREWVSLAAAFLALAIARTGASQTLADTAELYLLDVHSDGFVLAESLPVYAASDDYFVDLALFLETIEFPIARSGPMWSGWFHEEARSFRWLMPTDVVEIAGREPETLSNEAWFEAEDGVYVAARLIERWFGVELRVDTRQQLLFVDSDEPLPFENWQDRRLAKYRFRAGQRFEPEVYVPDQYNWVTPPLVNVATQITSSENDGRRTTSYATSLVTGMDLLKHSVVFSGSFARIDGESPVESESIRRLTVERSAATPDRPIFANVHHYTFGDIYQSNPNLVTSAGLGRGFTINRYSDSRTGNLNTVTITETAPPGWEVELYRNGTLIDFATVGPDGRYFFPDREIQFGENVFVAKLYGPQGQTREDSQTFWGGGFELTPGDYDFSVSHIDFDTFLLDGKRDESEVVPARSATDVRYTYAVSGDAEVGGAFTQAAVSSRARDGSYTSYDYLTAFGRARLGHGVLVGELVSQLGAGEAVSLEYLTGFSEHTISFSQRFFSDYESPTTVQRDALDSLSEISAFGSVGQRQRIGYRAGLRMRRLAAGGSDYRLFNRIGARVGPVSLSNEIEHMITLADNATLGQFRVAGRFRGISVRGQLNYALGRGDFMRQISSSLNWDITRRLNNNLTISRHLTDDAETYLTNMLSVRVGEVNLTFGASTDLDRHWSFAAGVNVGFGYDTRRRSLISDYRGLAQTGRATMNLFVDRNNNGVRDFDEPPVAWASYREQQMPAATPGSITLTGLPSETPIQIDTDQFKFDDPFLMPRRDSYEVRTHIGSDIELEVPIIMTGDIEGTLYAHDGRPARGVVLSLIDRDGREIDVTRSQFDGYYSFTSIPGGYYEIAIATGDALEVLASVTLDAERGYAVVDDVRLGVAPLTETLQ
jgi:hypothetical protein